jgi:hypothetical protein
VVGSAAGKVFQGDAVVLNPIDAIREGVTVEMKDSGGEIKKYWAADERG